jgi:malto-oligosyltrehalose trehalohydrolase
MTGLPQFGSRLTDDAVTFRLWAPAAREVELVLDRMHPMQPRRDGWYEVTIPGARAGTRYKFRIDGDIEVPDPASHFQPDDVTGPSEVIDHDAYHWRMADWRGRPWEEAAILECHVGTFSAQGTFRAGINRLDHLRESGLTALELMPLADFSGGRNWGYDGVLLYAPDSAYGRPEDLKALIDAAHARGLMVFLDVVYNHFGPDGNYLPLYAPTFFAPAQTPWGNAIDYAVPQVRAFAIESALHWLRHYRFDGLRLDAVHAILESERASFLHDLSVAVGRFAAQSGRIVHLVLENDDNTARLLDPREEPPNGHFRAQWNDDYHHAWHVLLTGEDKAYYRDYAHDPIAQLARILSSGFAYQGEPSVHRNGLPRGEPSDRVSPLAFVNFLHNHDQIGNRPLGDRLTALAHEGAMEAALAVTLLAPMPPLLFMGEEWGSQQPFPFFCDFKGELAAGVREGRKREFSEAYAQFGDAVPDALAPETFGTAVLDWDAREQPPASNRLSLVRELLTVRARELAPRLANVRFGSARRQGSVIAADWVLGDSIWVLVANLSHQEADAPKDVPVGRAVWNGEMPPRLPPWSVYWRIGGS